MSVLCAADEPPLFVLAAREKSEREAERKAEEKKEAASAVASE